MAKEKVMHSQGKIPSNESGPGEHAFGTRKSHGKRKKKMRHHRGRK
ncbi:MAG: hypothetical protein WAN50_03395 [Minisyncoccia bacterium]